MSFRKYDYVNVIHSVNVVMTLCGSVYGLIFANLGWALDFSFVSSSFRFALIFIAECANILMISLLAVVFCNVIHLVKNCFRFAQSQSCRHKGQHLYGEGAD